MQTYAMGADIVHAGAFFGDALPALSRSASRVWAFEPNSENYRCAYITIALNDLHNVVLTNAALGSRSDVVSLKTRDEDGHAKGGQTRVVDHDGDESVPLVRIDDVVPSGRMVSIIHFDLKGFEGDALKGAKQTIARCRPIIILETEPEDFESEYGYYAREMPDENTVFFPVR